MDIGLDGRAKTHRMRGFALLICIVLALLGAMPPPAPAQTRTPLKAQRLLLELARQQPDGRLQVVIQKVNGARDVEPQILASGGRITKDLSIINAVAAEVPGRAVTHLGGIEGVRWMSLDAPTIKTNSICTDCISTGNLKNVYNAAVGADQVWNTVPYLQGQGVGVAIIDSGLSTSSNVDLEGRVVANAKFNSNTSAASDAYGHGTHVAGIVAGNGSSSKGRYIGIAPKANIINVKVSDDKGSGTISDVVAGMQWVYNNRSTYNIRVVNISLNSSVYENYNQSPLCAAAEILWFSGIVVVVSAGNVNKNAMYPPANDPFVITVGAANDNGTASISDDTMASFSGYGVTPEGFAKPDLVAPGVNIVSMLSGSSSTLASAHKDHIVYVDNRDLYFRMSGTSMAAPVVAGAAALLLQDEPKLTPDQVKYRLKTTAVRNSAKWPGYSSSQAGAGYLNIPAAVKGTTTESANTGTNASQLLWTGSDPVAWNSVSWNSVSWNSVSWASVSWASVSWASVSWASDDWSQ